MQWHTDVTITTSTAVLVQEHWEVHTCTITTRISISIRMTDTYSFLSPYRFYSSFTAILPIRS